VKSFSFKKDFSFAKESGKTQKAVAHSTLAENMSLQDDRLVLDFNTAYEGRDLEAVSGELRSFEPQFHAGEEHNRDVQVAFDEN